MKYLIKNKFKLKVILKRFLIFTLPILLMFNFLGYIRNTSQYNTLESEYRAKQHELVSIVSYVLNEIFTDIYNDLFVLKEEFEFTDYIDNQSDQSLKNMEQLFFRVISSKTDYSQIRYINKEGFEVVRVNNYDNNVQIVPKSDLQDKSSRYYYKSTLSIPKDTLYVSYLDLNIENNKVIVPHEPVIRFTMPIYKDGMINGMIIINYDGYKILSILSKYLDIKDELINVGVFDAKSYWQFEKENTFDNKILVKSNVNEIIPIEILSDKAFEENDVIIVDDTEYQVQYISNLNDLKILFDSDNNIGVVSSFNIDEVISKGDYVILKYPIVPYISNLLIMAISLLIILLSYHSKTDKLMLSASKYISEYTHDGIIITDSNRKVIYCNNVLKDTFGYNQEMLQQKFSAGLLSTDAPLDLYTNSYDEFSWEGNIWNTSVNNAYILRYLRVKLIQEKKNNLAYYIGIYSEPKINQNVLDNASWNNSSIGKIDNNLISGLHSIFSKVFTDDKKNIVIVIKISDFNDISYRIMENDENNFILNITNRLKSILTEESVVLAPSSNLFIIKTPFYGIQNEIRILMLAIDKVFSEIHLIYNPKYPINYLSGVAISDTPQNDSMELLKNAFVALEALIKLKKSRYMVYNENIYDIVKKDKTIRSELRYAFERNEFSVVYQMQKSTDGVCIGVEALVRWKSKTLGNVSPNLFVPIMEESEYIKKLGKHVLKTVINDFETIRDIIPKDFRISINLSSNEFTDKPIVSSLLNMLNKSKLKYENFCFEITETALVNNLAHTNEIIHFLHEKNILVSIDDFGTGFSSLGYLKTLYADKLKVDRTFIKDYPEKDDGTMIKAIISMATQLKIDVIVEGIETVPQLELIKSLDCRQYQGYYGSKPIAFKQFVKMLKESL